MQKKMYVETEKEFKNYRQLSCFYLRKNLHLIENNQVIFFFLYLPKCSLDTKTNKKCVDLTTEQKVLRRKLSNNSEYIMKNQPRVWSMENRYKWLYTKKRYLGWADLEISADNLRITYTGHGKSDEDAAGIRTNNSIILNKMIFYFEIRILSIGKNGFIGIGLADQDANLDRLPGWEKNSLGYHGDDGYAFRDSGTGIPYGPCYGKNDIIGLCVNFLEKIIFFTKNGFGLKNAFYKFEFCQLTKLYPFLGLRTKGESIEANFGSKIYEFDVNTYQNSFQTRYVTKFLRYHRKIGLYNDREKKLANKLPLLTSLLLFLETRINVLFSKKKMFEAKHIEKRIQDLSLMESFLFLSCDTRKYDRLQKYKKIITLLSTFFAYKKEMCRNFSEYFTNFYVFTKHKHEELCDLKYEILFQFLKIFCVSLHFSSSHITKTYFTIDFSVACKNCFQIGKGGKNLIKKILNQFFCSKTNQIPQLCHSLQYFLGYCQIIYEKFNAQKIFAELSNSPNFIIKQKLKYVKDLSSRKTLMFTSFSCSNSNQFFVFHTLKKWLM